MGNSRGVEYLAKKVNRNLLHDLTKRIVLLAVRRFIDDKFDGTYLVKHFCGIFVLNHVLTSHNTAVDLEHSLCFLLRSSMIFGLFNGRENNTLHNFLQA